MDRYQVILIGRTLDHNGFLRGLADMEAPCNCGRTRYDVGCHWEAALAGAAPTGGINTLVYHCSLPCFCHVEED